MRVDKQSIEEQCDLWVDEIEANYGQIPFFSPFRSELEGIQRISIGVRTIFDQLRCRNQSATECVCKASFGAILIGTGVFQLAVPIIVGIAAYKYKNS